MQDFVACCRVSADRIEEQNFGIDSSTPQVRVALLWTLGLVVDEPGVEVGLQRIDCFIEGGAQGLNEELIQHDALEAFRVLVKHCPGHPALTTRIAHAPQRLRQ